MAAKRAKAKRTEPTARQHSDNARRERELKRLTAAVAARSVSATETKSAKSATRKAKS